MPITVTISDASASLMLDAEIAAGLERISKTQEIIMTNQERINAIALILDKAAAGLSADIAALKEKIAAGEPLDLSDLEAKAAALSALDLENPPSP